MSRLSRLNLTVLFILTLTACAPAQRSEELSLDREESALSVEQTELAFGASQPVALSRRSQAQAFLFTLSDRAQVTLATDFDESAVEVDTVLTLYRERKTSWGPVFASSDDRDHSRFSTIARELPAGRYRLLIKGFKRTSVGSFVLRSSCIGQGCPVPEPRCLFGGTFHDLRDGAAFEQQSAVKIYPHNVDTLTALQKTQLLSAVNVAYEEASDLSSAMESVDQSEVNLIVTRELATGRSFTVYEYGAGDNSYGGIFESESANLAAEIHDGDLYECQLFAP